MNHDATAATFLVELDRLRAEATAAGEATRVPMREVFALAKQFIDTPTGELDVLLTADEHDTRLGAVSVMDWQARRRTTTPDRRRDLFALYIGRHDYINTWDLVDRAAPYVLGGHLANHDRAPLYELARSPDQWRRRSAIVATYYFMRNNELDDTFAIAELLVHDPADNIHKAVGGWIREAGKHDITRLTGFLDRHAATMPRTTLRYAIEHLDPERRHHYMQLRARSR